MLSTKGQSILLGLHLNEMDAATFQLVDEPGKNPAAMNVISYQTETGFSSNPIPVYFLQMKRLKNHVHINK